MTTEVATLVAKLRADASGYIAGITQAVAANVKFSESQRSMVASTASAASAVGGQLTKYVSLPVAAVGAASIKMSMDYQKSFALMQGLAGVPAKDLSRLKDEVKSLAGEVGQSPQKLAKALYFITSGGIEASKSMDVLRASAKAATAGLGSVDDVAYTVVSAMNAFKDQSLTASQATDIMVGTVKASTFEIDQLTGAIGRVMPVADQAGISFAETGTALAILSQGGLDAHLSTTALLNVLQQTISPADEAKKALADIFGTWENGAKTLKDQGIVVFLQKIAEATKGDAAKLAALFPDIRGEVGAASLTKAFSNDPAKFKAIADDIQSSVGATDKAFKVMQDTMSCNFGQALARAGVALINLGDAAAPAINGMIDLFAKAADMAQHVPQPILVSAAAIGTLLAAAGPALLLFGGLSRAVVSLSDALAVFQARSIAAAEAQQALGASTATSAAAATGAATRLTTAAGLLAGAIVAIPAGLALGSVAGNKFNDWLDGSRPKVDELTASLLDMNTALTQGKGGEVKPPEFDFKRYAGDFNSMVGRDTLNPIKGLQAYTPGAHKAKSDIEDLNKAFIALLATQGPQKAKLAMGQFQQGLAALGIASPTVAAAMAPFYAKLALAEAQARASAKETKKLADTHRDAATATATDTATINAYNASLADSSKFTEGTIEAGQQAAMMLHDIGIAAHYAGDATVEGMTAAEGAARGLVAALNDVVSAQQASDSLDSSLLALQDAQNGVGGGGGGGGGGSGKTAIAAALDQKDKELALRDALFGVRQALTSVTGAQLSLESARLANRQAIDGLAAAEKNYAEVLHGVAAGSEKARAATLAYAQAKNDAAGSKLDTNDAKRSLAKAQNDKALFALNVADARKKLAEDMKGGQGATTTFLQTPKGSIKQTTGGSGPADASTILRDQIALKDALVDLSGADDSVKRAQLAVSNAQLAGKAATKAAKDAHDALNHTLRGYSANSKEAKDAQRDLTQAQLDAKQASFGVVTAMEGLESANNNVATAQQAAERAAADLKGQLDVTGGAARTAAGHVQKVAEAEHAVAQNMIAVAKAAADKAFNETSQPIQWAHKFAEKLGDLQVKLDPNGNLAKFFDWWIQAFQHLADIVPQIQLKDIHDIVSPTGAHLPTAGQTYGVTSKGPTNVSTTGAHLPVAGNRAGGGNVLAGHSYRVGEAGWEIFTPSVNGQITPHHRAAAAGGGAMTVNLVVQALDPATAGDVVVKALRDVTKSNGIITGVRTQ